VASLYSGSNIAHGANRLNLVLTATIEPRLEQVGQAPPRINVAMRRYDENREQVYVDEFLRLTVTDARELVTARN